MSLDRPAVTLHVAQSLDGRIAGQGARAELSTAEGMLLAHRARAAHEAVLVGARTVEIDDPLLTVRLCEGAQPLRVVLASTLELPEGARLLGGGAGGRVLVIGAEGRATPERAGWLEARGVEAVVVPGDGSGRVSLGHALAALYARGVRRLLVEGGALVLTSFLRERLADVAEIEIAPRILGEPALAGFGAFGGERLLEGVGLRGATVERAGENLLVRGELVYPG